MDSVAPIVGGGDMKCNPTPVICITQKQADSLESETVNLIQERIPTLGSRLN